MAIINQITFKNGIDANNAKRYLVKYSFDNLTKSGDTVTWGSDYEASNIEVEDLADDLKSTRTPTKTIIITAVI